MASLWSRARSTVSQIFSSKAEASNVYGEQEQEEGISSYYEGGFHPVRLGELYGSKYEVLRKLGYCQYSTV